MRQTPKGCQARLDPTPELVQMWAEDAAAEKAAKVKKFWNKVDAAGSSQPPGDSKKGTQKVSTPAPASVQQVQQPKPVLHKKVVMTIVPKNAPVEVSNDDDIPVVTSQPLGNPVLSEAIASALPTTSSVAAA